MSSSSTRVFDSTFVNHHWYDQSLAKILDRYTRENKSTLPRGLYMVLYDAATAVYCHESRIHTWIQGTEINEPVHPDLNFVHEGYTQALDKLMKLLKSKVEPQASDPNIARIRDDLGGWHVTRDQRRSNLDRVRKMPLATPTSQTHLALDSRLKSFAKPKLKWPHPLSFRATPETLARAGFFFTPEGGRKSDRVTCFVCNKTLAGWDPEDDPFTEHISHSPSCSWALARCSIEALRVGPESTELVFPNEESIPGNPTLEAARLATFGKFWPHDSTRSHSAKAKHMAKAGFIYTPTNDSDDLASCFYCNLGLDGWESTDDPYHEHQRRRPHCAFFTTRLAEESEPEPEPEPKSRRGKTAARKAQPSDPDAEEESAASARPKKSAKPVTSTALKRAASKSSKPAKSTPPAQVKSEPIDDLPLGPPKAKPKLRKSQSQGQLSTSQSQNGSGKPQLVRSQSQIGYASVRSANVNTPPDEEEAPVVAKKKTPRPPVQSHPIRQDDTPRAGGVATSGLSIPARRTPSPTRLPVPEVGGARSADGTPRAVLGTSAAAETPKAASNALGTPKFIGAQKTPVGAGASRIGTPSTTVTPRPATLQTSPMRPVFGVPTRSPAPRHVFGSANTNANANVNSNPSVNVVPTNPNVDTVMASPSRLSKAPAPTRVGTVRSPGARNLCSPGLEPTESSVPFPRDSSPMTPTKLKAVPAPSTLPIITSVLANPTAATGPPVDMSLAELDSATRALTLEAYVRREMTMQYEALKADCEREIEEFLKAAKETRAKIAAL
ncbi:hypothetical protein FRC06_011729 [Ceratobasidium sp. 370]|nr:hypothetical protein FRC06_011729 [Ceratobasidium sp. 370]